MFIAFSKTNVSECHIKYVWLSVPEPEPELHSPLQPQQAQQLPSAPEHNECEFVPLSCRFTGATHSCFESNPQVFFQCFRNSNLLNIGVLEQVGPARGELWEHLSSKT